MNYDFTADELDEALAILVALPETVQDEIKRQLKGKVTD